MVAGLDRERRRRPALGHIPPATRAQSKESRAALNALLDQLQDIGAQIASRR